MTSSRVMIFYSWQTDLPNATNRGFIERALENAARTIREDDSIQVAPVIDRDTIGVPGSPDIAETIFGKIDRAHIFVGDISIINQGASLPDGGPRPTPNPNVLLELGYALKALGDQRIILVLNDAYGGPELLPFDLRMRRVIRYHMPNESEDRATERRRLEGILAEGIRTILSGVAEPLPGEAIQPVSLAEQAHLAIEAGRPDQMSTIRQYMSELAKKIDASSPRYVEGEEQPLDEPLIQAIEESRGLVLEFAQLADTIARLDAREAAHAMYKGFSDILDCYLVPLGFSGVFSEADFDLPKFLGHELFVTFIACLLRENRWELIADLLDEDLYVKNWRVGGPGLVGFGYISQYLLLLDQRRRRLKLDRILHTQLLNEYHIQGDLARLMPMEQFVETDYLLFLRVQSHPVDAQRRPEWIPWSAPAMQDLPRFLLEAERAEYAKQLLGPLGVEDLSAFRDRVIERTGKLGELTRLTEESWGRPLNRFDPTTIGSR